MSSKVLKKDEPKDGPMRVRAITIHGENRVIGFYDNRRIREGQEFTISSKAAFSKKWMEHIVAKPGRVEAEDVATGEAGRPNDNDDKI